MESTAPPNPQTPAPVEQTQTIPFDDFAKIDLRVATVVEAWEHPNADKLLVLQIDLGQALGRRQICAGIRGKYEPSSLVGRQVVVVANLAPRKLRGETSHGMLLATGDGEGDARDVVLLRPDRDVAAGNKVS